MTSPATTTSPATSLGPGASNPGALPQVLVTGTSTGIGRACALHLASRGFHVWAAARNPDTHSWPAQLPSAPIRTLALDVSDPPSIARAVALIERESGRLFALVNNAGIAIPGPVEAVPLDHWRRQFEVNLIGTIAVTQAALPLLRRDALAQASHRCGSCPRIVMIGSISGLIATPILAPYCASKFALEALTDALRLELRPQRIGVSIIEPGPVQSEIWTKARAAAASVDRTLPALAPYAALLDAAERMAHRAAAKAIPAIHVARAVERCLTARRAPIRIQVGPGIWWAAMMKRLLPDRAMDALRASRFPASPQATALH